MKQKSKLGINIGNIEFDRLKFNRRETDDIIFQYIEI